jgi:uncharacterized protein (TIGR00369 family)
MMQPDPANPCFGCGGANARGMKLVFEADEASRRIIGKFRLGPEYQGATGFIHGGIIATVLDEVMSKVSRFSNVRAVTAEITVEYLRPVRVDEELRVEGFATRRDGRELYHEGEIRNTAGVLLARGRGRFVIIDRERYNKKHGESADTRARS